MTRKRGGSYRLNPARASAITLAYVHDLDVSYSWHASIVGMWAYDLTAEQRFMRGGYIAMRCGTDGLVGARNKTIEQFLDDGRADWLLWTDTDMGFHADAAEQLMQVADRLERPIVGGLCFVWRERIADTFGGYRCFPSSTVYDWVKTPEGPMGFQGRSVYPVNTLLRCAGTGSAFILIHRSVFEKLAEKEGRGHWYDRISNPTTGGQTISEDLSFCLRAGAAGFPLYVHTGIRTTHHKDLWVSEADFWRHAIPPPAKEQVAVLVPVMKRPQNAAPFMESLRASTGLATAYVLADAHDRETVDAWRVAGAEVIDRVSTASDGSFHHATFAQKVNWGFKATEQRWVFICGDDVRFQSGWLDHAQAIAGDRYSVIGTNDMANPRVMNGEHATHILLRRSYVEEQGASWDGPGVLAHEGYHHWFVDDEIVTAAKQRGVWAMALGSVVEHLHPIFGTAEEDEVHRLGQSRAKEDGKHFRERVLAEQQRDRARKLRELEGKPPGVSP